MAGVAAEVVDVVAAGTIKNPQTEHNRARINRKAINIKKERHTEHQACFLGEGWLL